MKHCLVAGAGYGFGDSLCLLSVAQSLTPDGGVAVLTGHPEVFESQPGISAVFPMGAALGMWDKWCKEGQVHFFPYWEITGRMRGLPDTLMNVFRHKAGLSPAHKFPDYNIYPDDLKLAEELKSKLKKSMIVVHRGKGREIKLLPIEVMAALVKELKVTYDVVQIGYKWDDPIPGALDLRHKLTFRQSMAVLKMAHMIVGHDSMPAHASGIVETPGVFMYGATSPADFGYSHNENIFLGSCSQEERGPCGRPCTWSYDYVAKADGGYSDWVCPDRVCMKNIGISEILERVNALEHRIKEGINWVPKRG